MDTTLLKQIVNNALKELGAAKLQPLPYLDRQPEIAEVIVEHVIAEALVESINAAVKYANLYDHFSPLAAPEKPKPEKAKPKPKKHVMPGQHTIQQAVLAKSKKAAVQKSKESKEEPKELKENSPTTREIRQYLLDAKPPFTRGSIYRDLKWKGTELTRAAVAGWFNRAIKKGELVESTTSGEYYLKGYVPPSKVLTSEQTSEVMAAMVRGDVAEFDVVSGAGGLR